MVAKGEYQGYWENGHRHGEGIFVYPNGDMYSGWWRFGEKEGTGTYTSKQSGMKMFGEWSAGQINSGKWAYPNGVFFEGKFANNKPMGEGCWTFKNGNKVEGTYDQKAKEAGEDDEPPAADEGEEGVVKAKTDLVWQAKINIVASANHVNSVE